MKQTKKNLQRFTHKKHNRNYTTDIELTAANKHLCKSIYNLEKLTMVAVLVLIVLVVDTEVTEKALGRLKG